MIDQLSRHGLQKVGRWVTSGHASVKHLKEECKIGINYDIQSYLKHKRHIIYAFVFNANVRYIGETSVGGLVDRFNGYRYGNPYPSDTNNRVKLAITSALLNGCDVEIWASVPEAQFELPGGGILKLPASKPLEEHLIAILEPDLNVKNIGTKKAARE